MKKLILHLLLFLAPIILIAYPLDLFISNQLRNHHQFALGECSTWSDIYDGKINADIVIYGSSRAWVQIDPALIESRLNAATYNMGIDGYTFWLQYLRHKLLLQYNTKPKLIIQSLDIFTLTDRKELYNSDQFLPYMPFNKTLKKSVDDFAGYNHFDYELPLVRYYGKMDEMISALKIFIKPNSNKVKRIKGYEGQEQLWKDDLEIAKKTLGYYEIKVDTSLLNVFQQYILACKAKNIKIIFVYSPEYIEGQKFVKNRSEIIDIYTNFSHRYNIPFYNYSNDTLSFQKKYFYNSEHLNKNGSELFTNKLIEDIKKTNIIQKQ